MLIYLNGRPAAKVYEQFAKVLAPGGHLVWAERKHSWGLPEVFPVRGHRHGLPGAAETAGSSDIEKEKEPDHG